MNLTRLGHGHSLLSRSMTVLSRHQSIRRQIDTRGIGPTKADLFGDALLKLIADSDS